MRTAVYVRLEDPRHSLLVEYAKASAMTLNDVVERLVDQLLLQVAPEKFRPPEWLIAAIAEGYIPLSLPDQLFDDDDVEPIRKVIKIRGAR